MRRLPIRVRLTAVFAVAMVVVLAGAALFVYVRLREDLNEELNAALAARAAAVATQADPAAGAAGDPEESISQVLSAGGRVIASRGGSDAPALSPRLARAAARGPVVVERRIAGMEGTVRVLGRPLPGRPRTVVAVGQSLGDRDEALASLVSSFAIGGSVAVLLASLLGYGLATAALRPVEAMRRRAAAVSLDGDESTLPLPAARDEVRRLGETLNAMLERLRRSFERERRFVADASHEMRTPIAVLKTELETLLKGDHSPETREALEAAADEADHLAHLAEDLLVLTRAADGALPVRPERLDARAQLEAARARFGRRAVQQERRIDVDAPEGLAIDADPLRLRQALGNLVDNALRHGAGDIELSARAVDGGTAVDVADHGEGFADEVLARAFERFARGDAARTRGGAGLGLAIVRAIAGAHGGHASIVRGAEGEACVRLWLPAAQAHLSSPMEPVARDVKRSKEKS
jgi:signal transduction histidine kinase